MIITSNRFEGETYQCYECKKKIESEQVNRETWECDDCKKKIVIDIGKKNGMLVRLHPNEVTEFDYVVDQYYKEFRTVKGVTPVKGGFKIGVADHGGVNVSVVEFVNCLWRDQ
ncbi:hypothetical protein P9027_29670 [Bacillus thuringiensis]|uniref:hypothetical protein n=1 Tax=Bacillus thuringiensis TaxID=1428 RepID=UPI002DBEA701|nr:hypothetical protein [Bacillus thuringiensis]MEC3226089.1 hypothetical protein [Bacillus thuringiensis]MEC3462854.1 hypothetical protein [Bacillus thuringiensis]MEC3556032.1 hypothetical protein [Bacillus thuringiensis]MED2058855.1 hypothetical protein [Bacillus thuringiensis]